MIVWLKQEIKPDFDRCEAEATRLLFKQDNLETLNIDVRELKFDKKIYFDSIQNYCSTVGVNANDYYIDDFLKDGCIIKRGNVNLVLYNFDIKNSGRLNWTLAHEVGHIYLGHTKDGEKEEKEAHWFAAQLLMPELILRYIKNKIGSINIIDLLMCFNVTAEAAARRLNSISRKYFHEIEPQEEAILNRFIPYLDNFCEKQKEFKEFYDSGLMSLEDFE